MNHEERVASSSARRQRTGLDQRPRSGFPIVALVLLGACARTVHTPVDVQLDVAADLPEAAVHVRLCVSDGPARSFGPGDGRYALAGLEPHVDPEVVVQALDAERLPLGQAGPSVVEGGYAVVEWWSGDDLVRCEGDEVTEPEEDAWVLGVRFWS